MSAGKAWTVFFDDPVPYTTGVRIQESLVQARLAGSVPDTVLYLQHLPVITLGHQGREQHLLVDRTTLKRRGIEIAHASRGGDVTYHGPGQLVVYPILALGREEADAHGYLHNLEELAIRTAADFGVRAWRREGKTGAWTDQGKLAAIGIRLKRWITFHGMSFNVDVDLSYTQLIVPCGLVGEPVTSLKAILGERCPGMQAVRASMSRHFADVCRRSGPHYRASGRLPVALRGILQTA